MFFQILSLVLFVSVVVIRFRLKKLKNFLWPPQFSSVVRTWTGIIAACRSARPKAGEWKSMKLDVGGFASAGVVPKPNHQVNYFHTIAPDWYGGGCKYKVKLQNDDYRMIDLARSGNHLDLWGQSSSNSVRCQEPLPTHQLRIYCRAAFILAALRQIHTFSLPAGCDVPRPPTRVLLLNNMVGAGDVDEDVSSVRATEGDKRFAWGGGLVGSTSRTWKKKQQRRPANMESWRSWWPQWSVPPIVNAYDFSCNMP